MKKTKKVNLESTHYWYECLSRLGERTEHVFAVLRPGQAIEYRAFPQARWDGVAALFQVLRDQGFRPPSFPKAHPESGGGFSWRTLWKAWRFRLPEAAFDWKRLTPRPHASKAWLLLSKKETQQLREWAGSKKMLSGAMLQPILLGALNRAVSAGLKAVPGARVPPRAEWLIPVNLRGLVQTDDESQNLSSFVNVPVRAGESDESIASTLLKTMRSGQGFALFWLRQKWMLRFPELAFARMARIWSERARGYLGGFSNLGVWTAESVVSENAAHDSVEGVAYFPPVYRAIPLGAGALALNGRLSLSLHAHAETGLSEAQLESWLAAWKTDLFEKLEAEPSSSPS